MVSLIFAESSLETIPKEIQHHNSVRTHARKLGKHPSEILLDNSWHYFAMRGLKNELKRGRPDIVHFGLLAATSTPLYHNNRVRIYIHTVNDRVIRVAPNVNPPKSYHRFAGVFEKLFHNTGNNTVNNTGNKTGLFTLEHMTFSELVAEIAPSKTIGLTREGAQSSCSEIAQLLDEDACIVIGGFQKGHYEKSTTKSVDYLYSIGDIPLESHVVTSRVLYEYEKTIFM